MSIGLKIKEVADASGFTAATLRYYEQIGLLPEVSRTPAGFALFAIFAVLVGAAVTVFVLDDLATMLRSWTPHVTVVASDAAAFPVMLGFRRVRGVMTRGVRSIVTPHRCPSA